MHDERVDALPFGRLRDVAVERKRHDERCALAGAGTFDPDLARMGVDKLLRNRKAQTEAWMMSRRASPVASCTWR